MVLLGGFMIWVTFSTYSKSCFLSLQSSVLVLCLLIFVVVVKCKKEYDRGILIFHFSGHHQWQNTVWMGYFWFLSLPHCLSEKKEKLWTEVNSGLSSLFTVSFSSASSVSLTPRTAVGHSCVSLRARLGQPNSTGNWIGILHPVSAKCLEAP